MAHPVSQSMGVIPPRLILYVQQLGVKYFIHVFLQELVDKTNVKTDI